VLNGLCSAEAILAYDEYLGDQGYSLDPGGALFSMIDYFYMITMYRDRRHGYEPQMTDFNQEKVDECFDIARQYMRSDKLQNLAMALNDFHGFLKRCEKDKDFREGYFGSDTFYSGTIRDITFPYDDKDLATSKVSHSWEIKSGMGWDVR